MYDDLNKAINDAAQEALSTAYSAGGVATLREHKRLFDDIATEAVVTGNIFRPVIFYDEQDHGKWSAPHLHIDKNVVEWGPYPHAAVTMQVR